MEAVTQAGLSGNSRISDAEVIERVLQGEKELYELLMRRHNQKLYRAVRSYLKEEAEAEDVMQDTYLKAYEKLHQFRKEALFSTWLIRIGINNALGKLREKKRFVADSALEGLLDHQALLPLTGPAFMNPEMTAIQQELKQVLEKAIDSLPEKYRIVYVLRETQEMRVSEIARCLDLTESNVKVRCHRARALLKESLYKLSISREVFAFGAGRCDALVARVMTALPHRQQP